MRIGVLLALVGALSCPASREARAETVVQATWVSPFGRPLSVSTDPTDGSCWAVAADLIHVAGDESMLGQANTLAEPHYVAVSPADGSCWVVYSGPSWAVRLVVLGDAFPDANRYHWAPREVDACLSNRTASHRVEARKRGRAAWSLSHSGVACGEPTAKPATTDSRGLSLC